MKKLALLIIAALAFVFQVEAQSAQTFGDAIEGQTIPLTYDYTSQSVTRLYSNGVWVKDFQIAEITATPAGVSYRIIVAGQPKGVYNFTVTISAMVGTNLVESLPSNICTITVRPNTPGQLRKL